MNKRDQPSRGAGDDAGEKVPVRITCPGCSTKTHKKLTTDLWDRLVNGGAFHPYCPVCRVRQSILQKDVARIEEQTGRERDVSHVGSIEELAAQALEDEDQGRWIEVDEDARRKSASETVARMPVSAAADVGLEVNEGQAEMAKILNQLEASKRKLLASVENANKIAQELEVLSSMSEQLTLLAGAPDTLQTLASTIKKLSNTVKSLGGISRKVGRISQQVEGLEKGVTELEPVRVVKDTKDKLGELKLACEALRDSDVVKEEICKEAKRLGTLADTLRSIRSTIEPHLKDDSLEACKKQIAQLASLLTTLNEFTSSTANTLTQEEIAQHELSLGQIREQVGQLKEFVEAIEAELQSPTDGIMRFAREYREATGQSTGAPEVALTEAAVSKIATRVLDAARRPEGIREYLSRYRTLLSENNEPSSLPALLEKLPDLFDCIELELQTWKKRPEEKVKEFLSRDDIRGQMAAEIEELEIFIENPRVLRMVSLAVTQMLAEKQKTIENWQVGAGIIRYIPEKGDKFRIAQHQLAEEVPTDDSHRADEICEVVMAGYRFGHPDNQPIRRARVKRYVRRPDDST